VHPKVSTTRRELLAGAALAGTAVFAPRIGFAQEKFPNRTVRVIVPFPAGATTDTCWPA
jgi:tripartite-type tricarboxylate transporter receptor subunit TctC